MTYAAWKKRGIKKITRCRPLFTRFEELGKLTRILRNVRVSRVIMINNVYDAHARVILSRALHYYIIITLCAWTSSGRKRRVARARVYFRSRRVSWNSALSLFSNNTKTRYVRHRHVFVVAACIKRNMPSPPREEKTDPNEPESGCTAPRSTVRAIWTW